ncbi:MAG: cupin domain-containing protein, partial [Chlamydiia bacterium]|nr:cupin domain-containing protein [Chlamydiia bacterium]
MSGSHLFHFSKQKPLNQNAAGARWVADVDNFPMLQGMSLYKLRLEKGAAREPHWHANADELGYCLQGKALVIFYASGNVREAFLVEKGDVFFIPSGALHTLVNVGSEPAEFILQFSNEKPKDFALSTSFHMFTPEVLGNTWGVAREVFEALKNKGELFFAPLKKPPALTDAMRYHTSFRYSL